MPSVDLKQQAENLDKQANEINAALANHLIQFDTMAQLQKEERIEVQKMYMDTFEKERAHYRKIIMGLIITLVLLVGGLVGGIVYVLANYDIAFSYEQIQDASGDGVNNIYDGIAVNQN